MDNSRIPEPIIADTQSTTALVSHYIILDGQLRIMEAAIKKQKESMAKIEIQLLEQFAQESVQSIRTKDGLAFLYHQFWANCNQGEALKDTAWGWLVKSNVNSQTISAAVRELDKNEEGQPILPEEVKGLVTVTEKWSVRVKKS